MELRHLHYFIAVAEELHFGRAAQRLGMAQPPLSLQIRKLEEELGVVLLERSTRRQVRLTEAGAALLREARAVVRQAEQAVVAAQQAARGQEGSLAIGLVGSVTFDIFPAILKTFRTRFPSVSLTLRELSSRDQLEALREDRIKVGLLRPLSDFPEIHFEAVMREPLVAALPEAHPLARRSQVEVAELAREPLILSPSHAGCGLIRELIFSACQRAGFQPNVATEASQLQTIVGLVAGDVGVALVPESVMSFERKGVVYRRLARPEPFLEVALAHRKGERSPLVQSFVAIVREVVALQRPIPASALRLIPPAS